MSLIITKCFIKDNNIYLLMDSTDKQYFIQFINKLLGVKFIEIFSENFCGCKMIAITNNFNSH